MLAEKVVRQMFEAGMSVDAIFEEFGGEVPKTEIYAAIVPKSDEPEPLPKDVIKGMYVAGETVEQIAEVYTIGDVLGALDYDVPFYAKIPSVLHHAFKARCSKYDMSMKEVLIILLDAFLRTDFDLPTQPTGA